MNETTLNSIITRALETGWAVNVGPWQDSLAIITPQPRRRQVTFALGDRRVLTVWAESADPARPVYLSGYSWLDQYPFQGTPLDTPQAVEQEVSVGGAGA